MHLLVEHWSFDPFLIIAAALVALHELGLARLRARSVPERTRRRRRRSWAFYAGLAVLAIAISSPIDYWASSYFYVHMIEHLLLMFAAPSLVVLGAPWLPLVHALPVGWRRRAGRFVLLGPVSRPLRWLGRVVLNPWVAVISFNAAMVLWHLPGPFDLAENNQTIHVWLMHGSFFATGVLFWLLIIPSYPLRRRASTLFQAGSIIGTNVAMFVLAMSLSIFTSTSWYQVYDHVPGVTMSPFADQQIGAGVLWICGDFWAVPALVAVFRRAIADEGGLADAVDRLLHRAPVTGLGAP